MIDRIELIIYISLSIIYPILLITTNYMWLKKCMKANKIGSDNFSKYCEVDGKLTRLKRDYDILDCNLFTYNGANLKIEND